MKEQLEGVIAAAKESIKAAKNSQELAELRVKLLGKKSELTELLKSMGQLSPSERPFYGKLINLAKQELNALFQSRSTDLETQALTLQLEQETIDVTLPGRGEVRGSIHPVNRVRDRVTALFAAIGFEIVEGPEVEDEYYNFEALNIPSHHPARAAVDTFYLDDGRLLRTHTSPVQVHVMESRTPPFRIVTPGRVYRRDFDPTHTPMFHQLEALVVDRKVTFAHLKSLLQVFLNRFFEADLNLRFRPSYFPFTEPSAEVDIEHQLCSGQGCRTCNYTGWLEILGCGMVHPNVLRNVSIDTQRYSGFAIGMGLDRLAMLRYGVSDLRLFFENDLRMLEQF